VEDNSERAALRSRIHNADVDVNYTIYYPLLRPYVSLFPNAKKDKSTSAEPAGDVPAGDKQSAELVDGPKGDLEMWKAVEEAMETGTLDRLRNSKEGVVMPRPNVKAQKDGMKGKTQRDHKREQKLEGPKAVARNEEDEGSDGGFFDE
jgi:hypothetical protein